MQTSAKIVLIAPCWCNVPHGGYVVPQGGCVSAALHESASPQSMDDLCLQAFASSLHRLQAELVAQARNVQVGGNSDAFLA